MNRIRAFFENHVAPSERLGNLFLGLVMVLTFTLGSGATVSEGEGATRQLLLQVVGCNVAWGLISGIMFLIDTRFDRGRVPRLIRAVQQADGDEEAREVVEDELDGSLEEIASAEERERLYRHIVERARKAELPRTKSRHDDLLGALGVFLLVMVTTVPAVLPFLVIPDRLIALRVSNALLVVLLFLIGYWGGRQTNANPWRAGLGMMLVGVAVVAVAAALGG
jgi:hypothetical protein